MERRLVISHVLSALGAAGLAVTIFGQLDTVLRMADWVHYVVSRWTRWTHQFWAEIFFWLPFRLDEALTASLTVLGLCSLMIVGTEIGSRLSPPEPIKSPGKEAGPGTLRKGAGIASAIAGSILILGSMFLGWGLPLLGAALVVGYTILIGNTGGLAIMGLVGLLVWAQWSGASPGEANSLLYLVPIGIGTFLMFLYDGPALRRRIYQTLIILVLLFALNEISVLGLNLQAPEKRAE